MILSGVLFNACGPLPGIKIKFEATKTTLNGVIVSAECSFTTQQDGTYFIELEPGYYAVSWVERGRLVRLGTIVADADSQMSLPEALEADYTPLHPSYLQGALDQMQEDVEAAQTAADNAINTLIPAEVDRAANYVETILEPDSADALNVSVAKSALRAEAARDAATINADVYDDTTAGLSATVDGDQFQVVDGLTIRRYRNDSGAATEVAAYPSASIDSLTVNRGKPFPLKPMVRDGVLSSAGNRNYNDFLLDARVEGPSKSIEGYYFRIAYFQNEVLVGGAEDHGVMIQRLPISTYSTASEPETLHSYLDTPIEFDRDSGVQTVTIHPERTLEPISIHLTLDTDRVYPAGRFIESRNPDNASGSWIIDTSCYVVNEPMGYDALTVNRGKPYPLSQITLGGVTSDENRAWSDLILDAEVIGAGRDKLYQLAFYQNGAVVAESGYGWIIREHDASDPDNVVEGPRIEALQQSEEIIDRAGGVQTIRIVPTQRPDIEIKLTVDADQLPPERTSILSNGDAYDGWSWVIDPSCHTYHQPVSVTSESHTGVAWEVTGGDLVVTYPSNGHYYRITFGPNGFNNLPNFKKVETSSDGVSWTILTDTSTDWLPPIVMGAVNNGDGGTNIYTGGNHGSSGGSGGEQTARNIHFVVAPDGRPVTSDDAGRAAEVVVTVVNEVMAYNTITLGRYVLRETFKLSFYAGGCSVTAVRDPYEAITLANDNGLQATTSPFQNVGTYMIYGGQQGRVVFDENRLGAGSASSYPDAWATVFQESAAGQFAVWMDREYGVGAGTFNPSTHVRFGSGTNWKIYNNVGGSSLAAGDAYTWRGGYAWMMPEALSGLDSMFLYRSAGEAKAAYAVDNQDWWKL